MLQASSPSKVPFAQQITNLSLMNTAPKHHTYSLGVIGLAIELAGYACLGNRQVVKVLEVIAKHIHAAGKIPCYNTIRGWISKRGYYHLLHLRPHQRCPSTSWAIIIDVSIRVGGQRLLLVLGIDLNEYNFDRPLTFSDVRVLSLGLRHEKSWSAAVIKQHVEQQVTKYYKVAYMVSDSGPSIKLAAKLLGIVRIDDVSHAFARILKREYTKRSDFKLFIKKSTHVRRYNTINRDSHLRPPQLRGTARFMNVSPLIKWAVGMLEVLDKTGEVSYKGKIFTPRHRAKVKWLLDLRGFVTQMAATMATMDKISCLVKHHGLSLQTVAGAKISMENNQQSSLIEPKVYQQILDYFDAELASVAKLQLSAVICSTDIVESFFGKYKENVPKVANINSHALRIVSYGREIQDLAQVKEMMECTSLKQLREWRDSQLNQDRLLAENTEKEAA
jgi:hypothetical protein